MVCANGAETARLLLISKSKRFPDGLANSSGLVGKYLMWDTGGLAMGLFEHPLNEYKGIQVTRVIHDYYRADPKRGFYGGAGLDARFNYYPANFALNGMPPDAPKWGAEYKKMLSTYFTHTMTVLAHISSLPQLRNSISLDPDVKDAWGLPAMRVTFDFHPDDVKTHALGAHQTSRDPGGGRGQENLDVGQHAGREHAVHTFDGHLPHGERSETVRA